jgi:hypothetical protein
MIFELREYGLQKGYKDEFFQFLQDIIIPFQESKGMTIVACFKALEEDDKIIWIRRYKDKVQLEKLTKEVYQSDEWLNNIKPKIIHMLNPDKMKITLLEPGEKSSLQ